MPRLLKHRRKFLVKRKKVQKSHRCPSSNPKIKTNDERNISSLIPSTYHNWMRQESLRMTIYMMYVDKYEHEPPTEWEGPDVVVLKIYKDLGCVRKDTIISVLKNSYVTSF